MKASAGGRGIFLFWGVVAVLESRGGQCPVLWTAGGFVDRWQFCKQLAVLWTGVWFYKKTLLL